jgi:hypothetical protein
VNNYLRLNELKADAGFVGTSQDAALLRLIERVSRSWDDLCERHFYSVVATKYFDGSIVPVTHYYDHNALRKIDLAADLISVTSITDDGTALVANSDYWLLPDNRKTNEPARAIELNPDSTTRTVFTPGRRKVVVTGLWGYSHETQASGLTGTLSSSSDTTLTASGQADTLIFPGDTLVLGNEQVYVSAVSWDTLTVQRGINGTTATAHTAQPLLVRRYPRAIEEATQLQVSRMWRMQQTGGAEGFGADSGLSFASLYPAIRDLVMPLAAYPVVVL